MTDLRHYILTMPVARDQYVTVWSNGPMKLEHFAALDRYLKLQKEIAAEDEAAAQGIETAAAAETAQPVPSEG